MLLGIEEILFTVQDIQLKYLDGQLIAAQIRSKVIQCWLKSRKFKSKV